MGPARAALPDAPSEPTPRVVSAEEGRAIIDERAKRFLGMSGEEFRRRYEAGELDPNDDNVLRVALLLPLGEE
jgi:hypothetical protein